MKATLGIIEREQSHLGESQPQQPTLKTTVLQRVKERIPDGV